MRFEDGDDGRTYWFRQSFIGEFLMCGHRAMTKLDGLVDPPSDATILGTALHSAIEVELGARLAMPLVALKRSAMAEFVELAQDPAVRWVKDDYMTCIGFLENMVEAWHRSDVRQTLLLAAGRDELHPETPFDVPLVTTQINGTPIHIRLEGRWDLCHAGVGLWDWKTAASPYKAWEKQRWAVQPTVYSHAAVELGLLTYPTTFRFFVFPKRVKGCNPEVVSVTRDRGHSAWLATMLEPLVAAHMLGLTEWPRNDQHALCSDRWCPAWEKCKGALISPTTW